MSGGEKKEEKKDEKKEAKADGAPKMGMLKLVPVSVLVGLVNIGATGFVAMRVMAPVKVEIEEKHQEDEHAAPGEGPGPTVSFDSFVVNLNEPGSNRYLKTTFDVEVVDQKIVEKANSNKALIRDEILRYLSGLSIADTMGEENKEKILEELRARMEKFVGQRKVERVLLSEFVVQ
ncbi:MAG: flagellar basal body-associated FliL family protein [Myxococcota bacterium]